MISINRRRNTWSRFVDVFTVLSEYSRSRLLAGGIPAGRVVVKPNFAEDPGDLPLPSRSNQVLFVGRLSPEKGVSVLISAWARAGLGRLGRLLIVGTGPQREELRRQASELHLDPPEMTFTDHLDHDAVIAEMARSRAVVLPSTCGENFPRTLAEAYACGRPVIVSDIGALAELVPDHSGLRVPPGQSEALAYALEQVLTDNGLIDRLAASARAEYLLKYTPDRNYSALMKVYRLAMESGNSTRVNTCGSRVLSCETR
jgi:glycosyltransferase involved in cell wall biosynthesis